MTMVRMKMKMMRIERLPDNKSSLGWRLLCAAMETADASGGQKVQGGEGWVGSGWVGGPVDAVV